MISASIVTFKNSPEVLKRTIKSFLDSTNASKVYVLDNASSIAKEEISTHPSIEYIRNSGNYGYGRAHNIAIKLALQQGVKYHLILNPDVSFDPDTINKLVRYMDENDTVGMIAPRVTYPNGELQFLCKLLPTPAQMVLRRFFPLKKIRTRVNFKYEMRFTDYEHITEVPFISGCFMLIRTNVFKTVGLFDERFFLYFEDTDFSRRVHKQFKTIYYPYARIDHLHNKASYQDLNLFIHVLWSGFKYFNKWGWFFDKERKAINQSIIANHITPDYNAQALLRKDTVPFSTNSFTRNQTAIIKTLIYFDIFKYPLKIEEINQFLHKEEINSQILHSEIDDLVTSKVVHLHNGFCSLNKSYAQVERRVKGNSLAQKRFKTAQKFAKLISKFPFVRAIMISGSLSKGYMEKESDIDYFIITEPGRLWLTRGMLALFKRVFLLNSHKNFCTNYFIDSNSLEIAEKNIYTATELVTLIPTYGKEICNEFFEKNTWTKEFLPNYSNYNTSYIKKDNSFIKNFLELILNNHFGRSIDQYFMKLALRRWNKKYKSIFNEEDFKIAFKSSESVSKNHPLFFQRKVLEAYCTKIEAFELAAKLKLTA